MPAPDAKPLPRHPRVWWSRIIYRWPFVIWLAAVAACGFLYMHTGQTATVSGVVEVQHEDVAPIEAARLVAVPVTTGQQVQPGDLLAAFDTSVLDAEMNEIRAQFSLDQLQSERQFRRGIVDAEARLHDLQLQQALDKNRLEALRGQLKDLDQVADASIEAARGMALYRAELDTLVRNEATYPAALRQLAEEVDFAREQLDDSRKANAPEAVRDLLASLEQRKSNYTLRARQAGTVSRVLSAPGDVVPEAQPVLSLVVAASHTVIAFLPEWVSHDIQVGHRAWLTRPMKSEGAVSATVQTLGPEILSLPTRVSPIQGQTLRGRRAVLSMEGAENFLPGESVQIHFSKPWWMDKYQQLRDRYTRQPAPAAPAS